MYKRLARFVSTHWLAVLFGWILIVLGVHQFAPDWNNLIEDGEAAYLPARMSSVRGAKLMKKLFRTSIRKARR